MAMTSKPRLLTGPIHSGASRLAALSTCVGLEIAALSRHRWDHHQNQGGGESNGTQYNLLAEFSNSIAAVYQDLGSLAAAARRIPGIPIVIATHGKARFEKSGIRCLRTGPEEARALTFGCGVAVLPRTRAGGFPVKLLNYMEAGRAIVAREGVADGLVHGRSAWLLPPDAPPAELAAALRTLLSETERAAELGDGARATLERRHAWPELARRTLDFVATLNQGSPV